MPQTSPSDVFNWEVVVGLVDERLFANTTLLNSGYIGDASNSASRSPKGDTITVVRTVPVAGNKGVQVNARTGAPVDADKVSFDSDEYPVVSRILAYDMDERAMAIMANLRDPNEFMADEVVKLANVHIQNALIAAGVTGGLEYVDPVGVANWKGIRKATTTKWGEKQNQFGKPLLVCHSRVMYDISTTEEAMKAGIFGINGVVESGQVYQFAGVNLMQLDSITQNQDGTYNNLILLPNALQFYNDEGGMGYHEQRKAHTTTWQLDWDFSFAAFLSKQKPIGCIVYKVASSLDGDSEDEE